MDDLLTFAVTWRNADAASLADWTLPLDEQLDRLPAIQDALGVAEVAYIATCNRVEVMVALDGPQDVDVLRGRLAACLVGADTPERRRQLRAWGGEGALEHLMLVSAGLDSAQLGEAEISGQVRRAMHRARSAGTLGPKLHFAFQQALKVSKTIQTGRGLRRGKVSLAEIALEEAQSARGDGAVVLLGVSPMTERCAESLPGALVVNRTLARAQDLADRCGGTAMALDAFLAAPPKVKAIITATGAPGFVLDRAALERLTARGSLRVVDLAVPPDVDPDACRALGVPRLDMDGVTSRAAAASLRRAEEGAQARQMVDDALDGVMSKAAARDLSPVLSELFRAFSELADGAADRALSGPLADLSPADQQAVRRLASELGKRLANLPASGLRTLAAQGGMEPVRAFLGFRDPLAERLRAAADPTSSDQETP